MSEERNIENCTFNFEKKDMPPEAYKVLEKLVDAIIIIANKIDNKLADNINGMYVDGGE